MPLDSNDRPRGVTVYKPKADVYTALLGIAVFAMLIAVILLLVEWGRYDYKTKAANNFQPTSSQFDAGSPAANRLLDSLSVVRV